MLGLEAERTSYCEVLKAYVGSKRRTYERAYQAVQGPRFYKQWAMVKMFVKPDKYAANVIRSKAPRAIQYRDPAFNLMVATYLRPLEHNYYEFKDKFDLRVVAKGLNNIERAQNLVDAAAMFENPVFVLLDHSKFDSHVRVEHLKFVHSIYHSVYKSRFLKFLLTHQIRNRGVTKGGIRYTVKGTRMSGDYDTALGNTLLNHYMLWKVFKLVKHHILLDGDDSVVVMEMRDLPQIDFGLFDRMGMKTEWSVATEIEDVEFCRSKLLPLDPPRFAREAHRALSNQSISLRTYSGKDAWQRYLAGVGAGEMAASNGVPILGPCARKLAALHTNPIYDPSYGFKGTPGDYIEPTMDARIAYWKAWGITPQEQLQIEADYVTPELEDGHLKLSNVDWYESCPAC
nr:MAG: RNA-dependent RNA polymerase [Riboviria sp.]